MHGPTAGGGRDARGSEAGGQSEIGAGVNKTLLAELTEDIRRLNRERGITFFLIEHDMELIGRLCDHVVCMAEGRILVEGTAEVVKSDARVLDAYLGGGRAAA